MSKVEQLENELQKLSPGELREVRDWLDNFVEDRLKFTPEFEAEIRKSEREMDWAPGLVCASRSEASGRGDSDLLHCI